MLISVRLSKDSMGTHGPSEATTSCLDVAENSESTVEIKIKTLDSQTYTIRVDKSVPIPKLKEQIATVTGVISEQQRLICRGKVLKDDEILSTYHVEDGHTLHLVVRPPHQSSPLPSEDQMELDGASSQSATSSDNTTYRNHGGQGGRTLVFETVNIGQGDNHTQHLSQIISSIINAVVTRNTGSQTGSDPRNLGARATVDIPGVELGSRQVPNQFQSAVPLGSQQPTVIPDSLTTMNQYLSFMRDEFLRDGLSANGREHRNEASTADVHSNGLQSRQSFSPGGLPSPASLAEILLSTRQLLMEQADRYINQFARRLEDQINLTDPHMRADLQNSVLRTGVVLQNMGSLLLELGRTTMTLRLGERPSEAVINAGPAVFISASGPNPVMVQPVPFYPGSSFGPRMGAASSAHASQGEPIASAHVPGNISIRFRAGRPLYVSPHNLGEQSGQPQGSANPTRNTSAANATHQTVSGVLSNATIAGESGLRLLPIRTVLAVPAGVERSVSDASGSSVGLLYPLLARVQHVASGNLGEARGIRLSSGPNQNGHNIEQQPNIGSTIQTQNIDSAFGDFINEINHTSTDAIPVVTGLNPSANEATSYQGSLRDFLNASQQGQPSSNTEASFGQQHRTSPISQLTSRLDQWFQTIFPGEQVVVGGTSHQESGRGSTTDQTSADVNPPLEEGTGVSEDGVFFSRLVRNLMPFISTVTSTGQDGLPTNHSTTRTSGQSSSASNSSHGRRDPPEPPSPKRTRRGDN
ncbi:large proline-rich protein BAG6 isoform X1 [Canna indica]|uniref:Large proline-rich protein BAG6 isoform X1 n=1 Tax=Canna indica TaxID=4628 RepID=A0AAQ3JN00_9LILI|nr:large proline-rich protein BAG6 isoform X1 [Canna indica]